MIDIYATVDGQDLTIDNNKKIIAGSINYVRVNVTIKGSDWLDKLIVADFINDAVPVVDGKFVIPESKSNEAFIIFRLIGRSTYQQIATNYVKIEQVYNGYC